MTPSEVYAAAAKMLEDKRQDFPCIAVGLVATGQGADWYDPKTLAGKFILTMAPGKRQATNTSEASDRYLNHGGLGHSVLALCFMAAIAADEERQSR